MSDPSSRCPEHGPPAEPGHRFCEVCGRNLATGEAAAPIPASGQPPPSATAVDTVAPPGPAGSGSASSVSAGGEAAAPVRWLSTRATAAACDGCGTTGPGDGSYCDHCGRRQSVGRARAELDLGALAGVTDRARRRHNEDAFAIGRAGAISVAVVCDGVSTSTRSDVASHAAAEAGLAALLAALDAGEQPGPATTEGARAAAVAARAVAGPSDKDAPPSCTYVSAIVTDSSVTVGWIGDSRAYWLSSTPGESACLTIDDSTAARLAAGRPIPSALAGADPRSRALIRWLGADSADWEPQLATLRPAGPGRLVLCSDGLSHYLSEPEAMATAVGVAGAAPTPVEVARHLTRMALEAGGHDNVAVVIMPHPPAAATEPLGGSVP